MNKVIDLTGQKFGRLTVIERAPDKVYSSGKKEVQWKCLCECGRTKIARGAKLRSGGIKRYGAVD